MDLKKKNNNNDNNQRIIYLILVRPLAQLLSPWGAVEKRTPKIFLLSRRDFNQKTNKQTKTKYVDK